MRLLEETSLLIDQAYRDALLSVVPSPALLGPFTSEQFQLFVDDVLQLLERQNHRQQIRSGKRRQNCSMFDQPRLLAIVDLIVNAIPTTDRQTRSNRHRRSLKLWTRILSRTDDDDNEARALVKASRSWPAAIRARFHHAWVHHERNRLRWRTVLDVSPVRDLSAIATKKSGI